MRQYKLEPKRLRLIQPRIDKPPNLVLAEGVKNSRPHVSFEPALIIYLSLIHISALNMSVQHIYAHGENRFIHCIAI